jgi:hypothetical protein
MKRTTQIGLVTAMMLACASGTMAQVTITNPATPYTQNFDALPNTGTGNPPLASWTQNSTLPGWYTFTANNADVEQPARILLVGTGSSNSGGIYSFGAAAPSTQRTFGFLGSGTTFRMSSGVTLLNNTGSTISSISIQYTGRQFRQTTSTTQNVVRFSYQITPATLTTFADWKRTDDATPGTTWIDNALLNFAAPKFGAAVAADGAIDGLAAGNFSTIGPVNIGSLSWGNGQYLTLRWAGRDNAGNDQGLGIDDLTVNFGASGGPANMASAVTNVPFLLNISGNVGYNFTTTNGGGTAAPAIITATIPSNVNYISTTGASGSFDVATRVLTITTGSIADAGGTTNFTVNLQPTVAFNPTPLVINWTTNPPNAQVVSTSTIVDNGTDISATIANTFSCPAEIGATGTFEVTANNLGPNAANTVVTATISPSVTVGTLTPSVGTASVLDNVVTWTIPAFASGASATLSIGGTAATPGAISAVLASSSNFFDPVLTNNAGVTRSNVNDTISTPKGVVLSSVASASSALVPASLGFDAFSTFSGTSFAFGRPTLSPDGSKGVIAAETTSANGVGLVTFDVAPSSVTLTGLAARRGVTTFADLGDKVGTQNPTFDRSLAINDGGQVAFTTLTDNATTSNRRITAISDSTGAATLVARQNAAMGVGFTGQTWGGTQIIAGVSATGEARFYSSIGGAPPTGQTRIIAQRGTTGNATQLLRSAVDVPTGQSGSTTIAWSEWQASATGEPFRGVRYNADGTRYLAEGFIDNPPTGTLLNPNSNQVVVVDGAVVLQEGSVVPGSGFAEAIRPNAPFSYSFMETDGTWFAYGANEDPATPLPNPFNAGQNWVVRNGAVVAKTGDAIVPASSEQFSDQPAGGDGGLSGTFILATGRGNDYVVGGLTNIADSTRRAVIVWTNGSQKEVVLRSGDPVDLNQNGLNDDNAYVNFIRDGRATIDAQRNLWVVADLRNGNQVCSAAAGDIIGQALLRFPLPAVSTGPTPCNPADIADNGSNPGADGCVDNGDFSLFISQFFNAGVQAGCTGATIPCAESDIADNGSNPGADGLLDNGDFSLFISSFFGANCTATCGG